MPSLRLLPRIPAILLAACCAVLFAACSSLGAAALLGDEVAFTAPQLQAQLDRRFPRDYAKLDGLLSLRIANPRLGIPPGSHRLRLDFDVGIGALGREAVPSGHMAIASGLRFDPRGRAALADGGQGHRGAVRFARGLHLDQPTLEAADFPGLGGAMNATGRELANRWLDDYARNEPVYRFDNSLVERIGARRIDSTMIDNGRIVLQLGR